MIFPTNLNPLMYNVDRAFRMLGPVPGSQMLVFCLQKITKINDIKSNILILKVCV